MGQITVGWDPETKKQKRETVYGDTEQEVRKKLDRLKEETRDGEVLESRITLKQCLNGVWLPAHRQALAERTVERYELDISYILRYLGDRPLATLTDRTITKLYEDMERDGYSGDARHQAGVRLRQALDYAMRRGYVRKNVAQLIPLPRVVREEMHPMTPEEVQVFLSKSVGHRLCALYVVALDSGAREGELFALEWSDWDPLSRTITITKALQEKDGHHKLKEPKSRASRRTVILGERAAEALEVHRSRQRAEGPDTKIIFADTEGGYLRRSNVARGSFKPILQHAGLNPEDFRFHDLRHTSATMLLMAGVDARTVAERLGHSDASTLLRTYAHVLPAMRGRAVSVMDGILRSSNVAVTSSS
jgi:integrase